MADHVCWWTRTRQVELAVLQSGARAAGLPFRTICEAAAEAKLQLSMDSDPEQVEDAEGQLDGERIWVHDGCMVHISGARARDVLANAAVIQLRSFGVQETPAVLAAALQERLADRGTLRARVVKRRGELRVHVTDPEVPWWRRIFSR